MIKDKIKAGWKIAGWLLLIILLYVSDRANEKYAVSWKTRCFTSELRKAIRELKSSGEEYLKLVCGRERQFHELSGGQFAFEKKGLIYQVFKKDSILFWTSNHLMTGNTSCPAAEGVYYLQNGWYYLISLSNNDFSLKGLALIKNQYVLSNDYLSREFHRRYRLPATVEITNEHKPGMVKITGEDGRYLCSLDFSGDDSLIPFVTLAEGILFLLIVFFMVKQSNRWLMSFASSLHRTAALLIITLLFFLFRAGMTLTGFTHAFYTIDFFSPLRFSSSLLFHSLADVLFTGLISLYFTYHLYRHISFHELDKKGHYGAAVAVLLLLVIFFHFVVALTKSLVLNSDLSFRFYHITSVSVMSFVALLALSFYLASLVLLIQKYIDLVSPWGSFKWVVIVSAGLMIIFLWAMKITGNQPFPWGEAGMLLLLVLLFMALHYLLKSFQFMSKVYLCVIVFALFTTYLLGHYTAVKQDNEKKILAAGLLSERDMVAEYLLHDIDKQLREDVRIDSIVFSAGNVYRDLYDFLRHHYFYGYWNNFDLQIAICSPADSLFVREKKQKCHCHSFFHRLLSEEGKILDSTSFYYLDDHNGLISYLGTYSFRRGNRQLGLYLQLDAKMNAVSPGYPELLQNKRQQQLLRYDYSFAKYYRDQLVSQSGSYRYPFDAYACHCGNKEFDSYSSEGYSHLCYRPGKDYLIMVSSPVVSLREAAIMFSYICVFYFLLVGSYFLFSMTAERRRHFFSCYRNKILLAISGISLMALFTLGVALVMLLNMHFHNKHDRLLREKLTAVYDYLISNMPPSWMNGLYPSPENEMMQEMLVRMSNIFFCDINLYSTDGTLMATSRPEIFRKHLQGAVINPQAYNKLSAQRQSEFVMNETLGTLQYLSAYAPVLNEENETVLYLNVPYFSRQTELHEEISDVLISVINISVLLIMLASIVAYVIANALTYPLSLIRHHFATIRLPGENARIEYQGKDELGEIIHAYNRMVEELDNNIRLLARRERESAWSEMARQIAHEIKNPLTPMKLGIQQLQRIINAGEPGREEMVKRISSVLIEQIDNLSRIAGEFSDFARMPSARNEKIKVDEIVKSILTLYAGKNIRLETHLEEDLWIQADREQMQRVFINLVTNALQSVPAGCSEEIIIVLKKGNENRVVIQVADNGTGVDPALVPRLFQPNFTTKSTGSGLGLAIVKNIIETAGGTISYYPNPSGGSIFEIVLPVV